MKTLMMTLAALLYMIAADAQTRLVKDLKAGKDRTLVVYGTSITRLGNGPVWVNKIGTELNARYGDHLTMFNKGGSGRNSQWGADNFADSVLTCKPDALMMEFSINDAVTRFDISPAQSVKNTEYMIRKAKEQNPECEVILLVVSVYPQGSAAESRPELPAYIQGYRDMASRHGLLMIDFTPVWDKMIAAKGVKLMRQSLHDGVHTTAKGSSNVIAPYIIEALENGKK